MQRINAFLAGLNLHHILSKDINHVQIENCVGFVKVPVGIAGPLRVNASCGTDGEFYAPLATTEAAVVASCSRGCKALSCRGVQFEIISEGMARAPVLFFENPEGAINFARHFQSLRNEFARWAASTSRFLQLIDAQPHIIGSKVHLMCRYTCGAAAGQNMVTKASQYACEKLLEEYGSKFMIKEFVIEGDFASHKKPQSVGTSLGVEVLACGIITNAVCQSTLGCTTERLYHVHCTTNEGRTRSGAFGSNANAANVIAALFTATGQDIASITEASWSHLTMEYNYETKDLIASLYIPSLPVGTIGGGTSHPAQQEALRILKCDNPAMKKRLAGLIASFSLALEVSTLSAVASNTFTSSHLRLARHDQNSAKL